jgi:hypothetical protein
MHGEETLDPEEQGVDLPLKKFCRDCTLFDNNGCPCNTPTNDACKHFILILPVEVKKTCNTCANLYVIGGCKIEREGGSGDLCAYHVPSAPSTKSTKKVNRYSIKD